MSLTVGIHENLIFSKAIKNDKGSLVIGFKEDTEVDVLAALNGGSDTSAFGSKEQEFLIFPPKLENANNEVDTPVNILKKIEEVVGPLKHILKQYLPTDKITFDVMAGTGITKTNMEQKITNATTLTKVYANIVDQFLALATPLVNNPKKMRMILIRQSAAKHFPTLRKRFLDTYPFIEPMEVPVSRLRFSDYEIKKGLDNPNPISGAAVPDSNEAAEADALLAS